jgi:isocitrate/isopropylmalate dehydrogenase
MWIPRYSGAPALSTCGLTLSTDPQHPSASVSIRQRTSAYVKIRQNTSAYVSVRQRTSAYVRIRHLGINTLDPLDHIVLRHGRLHARRIQLHTSAYVSLRQHTSEFVSIRQHSPAYVQNCKKASGTPGGPHLSEYVSIRQHTSAYVSTPAKLQKGKRHARRPASFGSMEPLREPHMSASVSIRQHTPAYVSIRPLA